MRFMQGNGRGCWAGARTIGVTTWQNKATVLKHRAEAIRDGWLVLAPEGKSKRPGELWASVPDGVKIEEKYLAAAVLPGRTGCPTASDLTPDNSITLKESSENEKANSFARSRERRIRLWLSTNPLAKTYRGDIDSLALLAPVSLRFEGYREVIRGVVEESPKDSGNDGK